MILFLPFILQDNCQFNSNPAQTDTDGEGLGDVCGKVLNILLLTDWHYMNKFYNNWSHIKNTI